MGKGGIDYGMGQTNVDHENGIRYGVIPVNDVVQAWADSSEADYGCEECESKLEFEAEQAELPEDEREEFDTSECICDEPRAFVLDDGEYLASQGGDDSDIFILKSPYYTYAAFCSPCAPGAGHLRNLLSPEDGVKTYCFGDDWFDDEIPCPYTVYRVVDDAVVYQPKVIEKTNAEKSEKFRIARFLWGIDNEFCPKCGLLYCECERE